MILASDGEALDSPTQVNGISLHRYPKGWLKKEAISGSLFAFHVAHEGIGIEDSENFLPELRSCFHRKESYVADAQIAALVLKMLIEKDWEYNYDARRRYFWALRTIIINMSAEYGDPVFSASALERFSNIEGVENLIDDRENSRFLDCKVIGNKILDKYFLHKFAELECVALRDHLMKLGGIARDSVRIIEEVEALAFSSLAVYL